MKFRAVDITVAEAVDNETIRLKFKNAGGQILELEVSAAMLSEGASFAQKALWRKVQVELVGTDVEKGDWRHVPLSDPTKFHVGVVPMLSPPAISLVFDAGTKWQVGWRFHQKYAEDLANKLSSTIQKAKGAGSMQ
jgi:hypothetical protein